MHKTSYNVCTCPTSIKVRKLLSLAWSPDLQVQEYRICLHLVQVSCKAEQQHGKQVKGRGDHDKWYETAEAQYVGAYTPLCFIYLLGPPNNKQSDLIKRSFVLGMISVISASDVLWGVMGKGDKFSCVFPQRCLFVCLFLFSFVSLFLLVFFFFSVGAWSVQRRHISLLSMPFGEACISEEKARVICMIGFIRMFLSTNMNVPL